MKPIISRARCGILWIILSGVVSIAQSSIDFSHPLSKRSLSDSVCTFSCNFNNHSTGYWSSSEMQLCNGPDGAGQSFFYKNCIAISGKCSTGITSQWMRVNGPAQLFFKYFFRGSGTAKIQVTMTHHGPEKSIVLFKESYNAKLIDTRNDTGHAWVPVRVPFCRKGWIQLGIEVSTDVSSSTSYTSDSTGWWSRKGLFGLDDVAVESLYKGVIEHAVSPPLESSTTVGPIAGGLDGPCPRFFPQERWLESITCYLAEHELKHFCGWRAKTNDVTVTTQRLQHINPDMAPYLLVEPKLPTDNAASKVTLVLETFPIVIYAEDERFLTFWYKFAGCEDCKGKLEVCEDKGADLDRAVGNEDCLMEFPIDISVNWFNVTRLINYRENKRVRFRFVMEFGHITAENMGRRFFCLDKTWYSGEIGFKFDTELNSTDVDEAGQCKTYNYTSLAASKWHDFIVRIAVGCGVSALLLIIFITLFIYLRRTNRHKTVVMRMKKIASLTRKELHNAYKISTYVAESRKSSTKRPNVDTNNNYPISPNFIATFPADFESYAGLLDVSPDSLTLSVRVLGKGEFGTVYKGQAETLPFISQGPTTVAVKSINNPHDQEQQHMFAEEVKAMMKAGQHVNIVNILGIVRVGRPLLIMEYCQLGCLLSYIRNRRNGLVYSHVAEDGSLRPFDEDEMRHQWLGVCERESAYDPDGENMRRQMLATDDLIRVSHQISRGMEYLASREIIHRDLAARNVLLGEGLIAKISDFGLAKHGGQSYTVTNGFTALPILWMPPDTIINREFSEKSDVWSFGVTLWEIFSLGLVPFDQPNVRKFSAASFAEWLQEGHQMGRPDYAPNTIYSVMKSCWRLQPNDRPTFTEIWKILDGLVASANTSSTYLPLDDVEDSRP